MASGIASDSLGTARSLSPVTALGLERIREFLETDGAIPAVEKALFTAAAAASLSRPLILIRELQRARKLALEPALAAAAARIVLLNRGERAFLDYSQAVQEVFGDEPGADSSELGSVNTDEALAYFRSHFGGEVPERQLLLARFAPKAFESFYLMHRAALTQNIIPPKTCELMICTLVAATYTPWSLEIHMRSAVGVGATQAELAEAVLCAVPVAGFAAWSHNAAAVAAIPSLTDATG